MQGILEKWNQSYKFAIPKLIATAKRLKITYNPFAWWWKRKRLHGSIRPRTPNQGDFFNISHYEQLQS